MIVCPLGILAAIEPARSRRPDFVLGLKVNPLRLQRAMIYAGINIQLGKPLVDMVRPWLGPVNTGQANLLGMKG